MTTAMMLLRYLLIVAGTWAASKGWVPLEGLEETAGLIVAAAAAVWGLWANRPLAKIEQVAALPQVKTVVTDIATAAATKADNVRAR